MHGYFARLKGYPHIVVFATARHDNAVITRSADEKSNSTDRTLRTTRKAILLEKIDIFTGFTGKQVDFHMLIFARDDNGPGNHQPEPRLYRGKQTVKIHFFAPEAFVFASMPSHGLAFDLTLPLCSGGCV